VTIDEANVKDLLQNFLAGNIQSVQSNPSDLLQQQHGKKPVAVIFSSSVHVVDLGELQATPQAVPAFGVSDLVANNASTDHQHAFLNATSILNTILAPLVALTHIGQQTAVASASASASSAVPPTPPVAPVVSQATQMQPIVILVPASQMAVQQQTSAGAFMPQLVQPDQIQQVLANIMKTKAQLLTTAIEAGAAQSAQSGILSDNQSVTHTRPHVGQGGAHTLGAASSAGAQSSAQGSSVTKHRFVKKVKLSVAQENNLHRDISADQSTANPEETSTVGA